MFVPEQTSSQVAPLPCKRSTNSFRNGWADQLTHSLDPWNQRAVNTSTDPKYEFVDQSN